MTSQSGAFRENRRSFLFMLSAAVAVPMIGAFDTSPAQATARVWPKRLTDREWRVKLSKNQYWILRQAGTERPGSSPLNREHRKGTYLCAGCQNALYSSATKFDGRTGWPSFWKALPGAIVTDIDNKIGMARTEVLCADCGGHLGHVFDDGPRPTGKRYCMNGGAMNFRPA